MTTRYIVNHFKRKGYYIALCLNTGGKVIVKTGRETKLFNSYAAAHKYYFGY